MKTDNAYFAGLFDGEGCVFAHHGFNRKKAHRFNYGVHVSNTDPRPLLKLQEAFGGAVKPVPRLPHQRPLFKWIAYTRGAVAFAHEILPYTIIKRDQLEMMIALAQLCQLGRNEKLSKEEISERMDLIGRITMDKKNVWELK